jgi:putative FmdB family regulatory protein
VEFLKASIASMPNYKYACSNCYDEFDIYQSIKAESLTLCSKCNQNTLYRVICAVCAFVKGDPKTIGVFTERKMSKMSNAEKSELYEQQEIRKEQARVAAHEELTKKLPSHIKPIDNVNKSGIQPDMSLNKLNPHQAEKYIMTGDK